MSTMRESIVRFTGIDNLSRVADRAAGNVERANDRMSRATERSSRSIEERGRAMDMAGRGMMHTAGIVSTALTGGMVLATKTASDMEEAFAGVRKVTDLTDKEYADLERTIMNMSKRIPASFEEISGAMEVAGRLGIEGKDNLEKFSETMLMMGVATEMSAEDAANSLARFMNVMGTDVDNVDRLASTVVALGNNFATTEPEIMNMAQRLSSSASILGMTEAETMGLAAAMSALGLRAEMGGSAMTKTMNAFNTDMRSGGEAAQKWADVAGVSMQELADVAENDMATALSMVIKGMGELGEEGANLDEILRDLGVNDIRQLDTLKRLAGGYNVLEDALKLATSEWETNTALVEEAEIRYGTFASQLKMFVNRIRNVLKGFGQVFMEVFSVIIQAVTPAIEKIEEFTLTFFNAEGNVNRFGKAVGIAAVAVTAMVAAMIPLGFIVMLAGQFAFLANALGVFVGKVVRVIGLISVFVGAIVGLSLAFVLFRDEINAWYNDITEKFPLVETAINKVRDAFEWLIEKIAPFVQAFWNIFTVMSIVSSAIFLVGQAKMALVAIVGLVISRLKVMFALLLANPIGLVIGLVLGLVYAFYRLWNENEAFRESMITAWQAIKDFVNPIVEEITLWIIEKWAAFMTWWNENKDGIYDKAAEVWGAIRDFLFVTIPEIVNWIMTKFGELSEWWNGNQDGMSTKISEVWTAIKETVMPAVDEVTGYIKEKWQELKDWWNENQESIRAATDTAWNFIMTIVMFVVGSVVAYAGGKVEELKAWWNEAQSVIKTATEVAWEAIKWAIEFAITAIINTIIEFAAIVGPIISGAWDTLVVITKIAWDLIKLAIDTAIDLITGALETLAHLINGDFSQAWKTLQETIGSVMSNIWTTINTIIGRIWDFIKGWLSDMVADWRARWQEAEQAVDDGVQGAYEAVVTWLGNMWDEFTGFFVDLIGETVGAMLDFGAEIANGMSEGLSIIQTGVVDMINAILEGDWVGAGMDLVRGVIDGIKAMWGSATSAARSLGENLLSSFKGVLGIKSPSREFMKGGSDIVAGAVKGIDRNARDANRAAERLSNTVINGFGNPDLDINSAMRDVSAQTQSYLKSDVRLDAPSTTVRVDLNVVADQEWIRTHVNEENAMDGRLNLMN